MTRVITHSAEETRAQGELLGQTLMPGTLVCLRGALGAGKTTFMQGVLAACGAEKPYVSPTFVLMKEYDLALPTATGIKRIYHADAYRIDTPLDFEKIGFSEWLSDREGVVLLEWPEKVEDLLPEERCEITLTLGQEDIREVRIAELKRHAEACETGCKTA